MPAPVIETIRNGLIKILNDFVGDAGFHAQIELIVELVYELAEYREEDVPFFPSVYVVKRANEADTLSIIAPGAERISIRSCPIASGIASRILKDSAALADGGWSVFIDVSEDNARYGLFRSELLPISTSSAEHMADPATEAGSALLIRNCARNCVEILAADGRAMEFGLTASRPTEESVSRSFQTLSKEATRGLPEETRAASTIYLNRVITQVCRRSRGLSPPTHDQLGDDPSPSLLDRLVLLSGFE